MKRARDDDVVIDSKLTADPSTSSLLTKELIVKYEHQVGK